MRRLRVRTEIGRDLQFTASIGPPAEPVQRKRGREQPRTEVASTGSGDRFRARQAGHPVSQPASVERHRVPGVGGFNPRRRAREVAGGVRRCRCRRLVRTRRPGSAAGQRASRGRSGVSVPRPTDQGGLQGRRRGPQSVRREPGPGTEGWYENGDGSAAGRHPTVAGGEACRALSGTRGLQGASKRTRSVAAPFTRFGHRRPPAAPPSAGIRARSGADIRRSLEAGTRYRLGIADIDGERPVAPVRKRFWPVFARGSGCR